MTGTHARGRLAASLTAALVAASLIALTPSPSRAEPTPTPPGESAQTVSIEEAAAQARATGRAVDATEATTGTDTLLANPDGTMTLSRTAVPVRAKVDGQWKALDPTLVPNPDGSWSPKVSAGGARLTLSNGGDDAMATMSSAGLSAGISAPQPLRAPQISGDTATYPAVLPGVDLKVTAKPEGGFSEVFVVQDPDAAKNADLRTLLQPTQLAGLTLTTDATGNITGADRTGATVLTAPAPLMWDSTAPPANKSGPAAQSSTFRGPGADAHTAPVATRIRAGDIELTPDKNLLTGAATHYPVYIDPTFTWSVTGAKNSGWATLPEEFPGTHYWKISPDPQGLMQVGNPDNEITSRTFINFPIATSELSGATINTATMKVTQTRAYSCTASRVNLFAPSTTLTAGNASWDDWKNLSLGSVVDYQTVAHGYDGCPAAAVAFDIKSTVTANVAANKKTQTFALVAADMTADNGWKKFLATSPTIEITYNHKPNKPTGMTTSPPTSCAAATPTVIGDGEVVLYAPVSDRNGSVLGVTFNAWKTSTPDTLIASSNPNLSTYKSGTTGRLLIPVSTLRSAAGGPNGAITQFSWRVRVTDLSLTSDWSATCNFKFDPTRTGPPTITAPDDGTTRIGQSVDIPIAKGDTGSAPTAYLYQINGAPHGRLQAAADGSATISVTPGRFINIVSVSGVTAGGNIGDTAIVTFNSDPAEEAIAGDFDGDEITDIITAGGRHNLASGLWLASQEKPGQLAPAAANIGARGDGVSAGHNPTDFDGAQIIAGKFAGAGLQDVLAYYPSGPSAGTGVILRGNGDGSTIQTQLSGTYRFMFAGTFSDATGLDPLQLVNAGHTPGNTHPDLLGIAGSAASGYYLNHYPNLGISGGYGIVNTLSTQTTPTGDLNWNNWTLASTPDRNSKATVFLWNKTSGALYAWRDLAYDDATGTLTFTQQQLATSWNAGKDITPYAADIDNDGRADLWAIAANAQATAYLATDAGLTAATPQTVLTAQHAWLLKDAEDGPVTSTNAAKDSVGSLTLTGSGGAAWDTGDLYDPAVALNGTNGMLTTTSPIVSTTADFTISAWVKPSRTNGTVLSQDGPNGPGFRLWIEDSDDSWRFSMANNNAANPALTNAIARRGSATAGVWTHIAVSFKRSTNTIDLHINGKDAASAIHPSPWNATGIFRVGAQGSGSGTAASGFFQGRIAEVLTYNSVVIYDDGNPRIRDFSGDNITDILCTNPNTGLLYLYRGNGAGLFRSGNAIVGRSWQNMTLIAAPGDFDNDGNQDMIARRSDGTLWLYRGNGAAGWLNGNNPDQIGTAGFGDVTAFITPGDFTGDGFPDIIVRRSDGTLWLYRGNGAAGWLNGANPDPLSSVSFNGMSRMFSAGDFDGDGYTDMLAVRGTGELVIYRGNGRGNWLTPSEAPVVGTSFNTHTAVWSPGDFNGDGHPDVMTRRSNGQIWLYRSNGTSGWINGGAPDLIGNSTGWNAMNMFM